MRRLDEKEEPGTMHANQQRLGAEKKRGPRRRGAWVTRGKSGGDQRCLTEPKRRKRSTRKVSRKPSDAECIYTGRCLWEVLKEKNASMELEDRLSESAQKTGRKTELSVQCVQTHS